MAVSIHFYKSTVNADGTLSNDVYIKGACLSTDSKPTENIAVGSELIEADTGKTYMYSGSAWIEQPSSGGGGGSSNKFIVTLTPTAEDFSGTMDKTPQEITAAYEAGQDIWFMIYTSAYFYYLIKTTFISKSLNEEYMSFGAVVNYNMEYEIEIETNSIESTYFTTLYTLNPVS